ncbi:hypothetical protein ciss_07180 [Carboxydothermus islandicus]|uniref:Uncharacterized protein n=1 Tax=Carboxydothermus islandicus TaxID=661089 RepID=A0A1L8D0R9_9THEO|nr:hypothetical protein [Carboxydothermus islandicus]GAV24785.1 hypothetical protein ciss_07180 [Carboxydothermus islandicus]
MSTQANWAFHCGSQYADWVDRECGPCEYYDPKADQYYCEILKIADEAALGVEHPVPKELELIDILAYHPYRCKRRKVREDHVKYARGGENA